MQHFSPSRHCLITKWVYFKIIVPGWLVIFLLAFAKAILIQTGAFPYACASLSAVNLLVLAVSYIKTIATVQSSPHSQHHGSIHKERKLSVTFLIGPEVSVLTIFPLGYLPFCGKNCPKRQGLISLICYP